MPNHEVLTVYLVAFEGHQPKRREPESPEPETLKS